MYALIMMLVVVTEPQGVRFSVTGNVLALSQPRSAWKNNFKQIEVCLFAFLLLLYQMRANLYYIRRTTENQ